MANLFNSNPLMGLGLALSTFGGQEGVGNALNLLNFAQRQQLLDEERRKEDRKENMAAAYLKNTGQLDLPPEPDVMTGISNALNGVKPKQQRPLTVGERVFNGFNDRTDTSQVDLMNAVGAENLLNSRMQEPKIGFGKPGEVLIDLRTGKAIGPAIPGGEDIPEAVKTALWQAGGDPVKARAILEQKMAGAPKSVWKTLSAADAQRIGLPAGGTYQQDQNGQVQVITQPKQDIPTEGQEKFAFNADRVGGALGAVKEILGKNPTAASNFWLEATDGVPGLDAAGRKMVNDDAQIVRNNLGDAIDAIITLGTGAAYTEEQLKAQRNKYLPRPGESPKVIKSKFDALASVYENAKKRARTAGRDLPDVSEFAGIYGVRNPNAPAGASVKWGADVDALLDKYAPR